MRLRHGPPVLGLIFADVLERSLRYLSRLTRIHGVKRLGQGTFRQTRLGRNVAPLREQRSIVHIDRHHVLLFARVFLPPVLAPDPPERRRHGERDHVALVIVLYAADNPGRVQPLVRIRVAYHGIAGSPGDVIDDMLPVDRPAPVGVLVHGTTGQLHSRTRQLFQLLQVMETREQDCVIHLHLPADLALTAVDAQPCRGAAQVRLRLADVPRLVLRRVGVALPDDVLHQERGGAGGGDEREHGDEHGRQGTLGHGELHGGSR